MKRSRTGPALFGGWWLPVLALAGCAAGEPTSALVSTPSGAFGEVMLPVSSLDERRFATVVRQRYDFSCGSAALATLLGYHYSRSASEEVAFRGMWAKGDQAQIRRLGFSLLDMQRYLASLGLKADGYEVSLPDIRRSGVPGIALLELQGYRHFVVVKGVTDDEVLVGDPALGLRTMPLATFKAAWNGIYFVLDSELERGRRSFNGGGQWAELSRAPTGSPFLNPLSVQSLMLTAPAYREF